MIDHLQQGALDALRVEGEEPQHHESQVANRRECHQLLGVGLLIRDQGAVEDADDGETPPATEQTLRPPAETCPG